MPAWPRDFAAKYGNGLDRTLVLGGGGLYFVTWQVTYLSALEHAGVSLKFDRVVGTSAGSIVAAALTAGKVGSFAKEVSLLAKSPKLVAALAPSGDPTPSQTRALEIFRDATNGTDADEAKAIGYAALAASTPSPGKMVRSLTATLRIRHWPDNLYMTTVDTYTGERIVLGPQDDVPVANAAAASSSVPGIFSPQPLLDRKLMDGGVGGSHVHSDLVAGANKAMMIALGANGEPPPGGLGSPPGLLQTEQQELESLGTKTALVGPEFVDIDVLMDPNNLPMAIEDAHAHAERDKESLIGW